MLTKIWDGSCINYFIQSLPYQEKGKEVVKSKKIKILTKVDFDLVKKSVYFASVKIEPTLVFTFPNNSAQNSFNTNIFQTEGLAFLVLFSHVNVFIMNEDTILLIILAVGTLLLNRDVIMSELFSFDSKKEK